jgi:hypothetical protein
VEQVLANNRPQGCLNIKGYANLVTKFNEQTGRNYTRVQMKNRWDALKSEFTTWKTLLLSASGLGRDPKTLRNVIERSFGVLKMKWRILLNVPSYSMEKQTKIIIACMALHNFIRDSNLSDVHFDTLASDDTYVDGDMGASTSDVVDHEDMGGVRDAIAQALMGGY